jgi:L-asparaginase II
VAATAVDGCGAPALAIPLVGLARVFARIATAEPGSAEHRVATAVRDHPDRLGGTGRDVTRLLEAVPGLVAKDGADGVYAAALPDGRAVALKVADGSSRARRVALLAALRVLGVQDVAGARRDVLDALGAAPVLGHGEPVGALVPAGWAPAP